MVCGFCFSTKFNATMCECVDVVFQVVLKQILAIFFADNV